MISYSVRCKKNLFQQITIRNVVQDGFLPAATYRMNHDGERAIWEEVEDPGGAGRYFILSSGERIEVPPGYVISFSTEREAAISEIKAIDELKKKEEEAYLEHNRMKGVLTEQNKNPKEIER